ncbi:beta-1,6-N-acetylglucosaminyltransferase [Metabacillus rhizolycopersici]|uniref:Peptide O-xylosyltransferase n=1 Tax=Metabacillus rhizolycopersici TaxID=2875709 RepID=A0ABS7UN02_9BACI|nr:beta-1,6-N-acetylglucosaminyltransferase [Metabacillus rhizolycopersici]MBZ5749691.1 beta-1,6-N-acetylglucosaminyltransferase [Metabacillus rhizolycopersici]
MNSIVPRTAYILQIHKNPNQVNKFINQIITEEQADVFIHIDKQNYNEINEKILKSPNVKVLKESINVRWGDISQIDATVLLLKNVFDTQKKYDFVCFRSGQDLLVKNGFKEYLLNNKNKIFMTASHIKRSSLDASFLDVSWPRLTRKQYNTFNPFRILRRVIMGLYGKGLNIFPNPYKLPENFSFYHGSQWFCIPIGVVKYIIEFLDQNKWYYLAFENALCPDEWFFQTLIMNSTYKDLVENNNLLYIKWGETFKTRNHPKILTMNDIDSIESSNQYFARKFDENVDKSVLEYYTDRVRM